MLETTTTINKKFDFPKLMIANDGFGETIVLMLDKYGRGNGIATNHKSWEGREMDFYETSNGWKIEDFKDYQETLSIKNK